MTLVRSAIQLSLLVTMIAAGGCATIHRNEAKFEREFLVPAGFDVQPADSAERMQELRALPPLEMVTQESNGQLTYRLADPYLCDCVYVGDRDSYGQYQRLVSEDYLDTLVSIHLQ